jgi:tetratricopeptide (TPR) repeat protein
MNIFLPSTLLRFLRAGTIAVAAVVMPTVAFSALDSDSEGAPASGARTLKKTERVRDFNADPALSDALQKALGKAKDQARAHYNEGQALFKTAEQSERRVDYEAAAAKFHEAYLYDSDPSLLQWEALSWLRAQKYENAERAFRKVLSHTRAMNITKQDAIDYLAQIEQQKADSGKKADEKIAYAINLGLDAPSVEVGKLLVDAFANDPKSEYAYFAAKAYANAGDKTRAAGMYREALSTSASEASAYKKVAESWLEANGLTVEPKYSHLKAVRSNYTETQHPSTEYLEEFKPQHDVWGGQIRPAIQNFLGLGTFEGRDVTGDRERFKYRTVRPLGAGVNQNDLLIQGVSYVLSKVNWSEDKKKEVLAKVGLSSKDLVSSWPIVDAIKSASVTYLKTDAERAPYRLSMTNDGILMRNGSVFDTR